MSVWPTANKSLHRSISMTGDDQLIDLSSASNIPVENEKRKTKSIVFVVCDSSRDIGLQSVSWMFILLSHILLSKQHQIIIIMYNSSFLVISSSSY